jgi:hypothetical protein
MKISGQFPNLTTTQSMDPSLRNNFRVQGTNTKARLKLEQTLMVLDKIPKLFDWHVSFEQP